EPDGRRGVGEPHGGRAADGPRPPAPGARRRRAGAGEPGRGPGPVPPPAPPGARLLLPRRGAMRTAGPRRAGALVGRTRPAAGTAAAAAASPGGAEGARIGPPAGERSGGRRVPALPRRAGHLDQGRPAREQRNAIAADANTVGSGTGAATDRRRLR